MTTGYIPLIGGDKILSIKEGDNATAILLGTIAGAAAAGRPGSMKASLLVRCDVTTVVAPIFYIEVACPPGLSTPASNLANFDYTTILPTISFLSARSTFNPGGPPNNAWPANLSDFFGTSFVSVNPVISATLFNATPPTSAVPYGSLTYEFFGSTTLVGPGTGGCLATVTIDFGASVSN